MQQLLNRAPRPLAVLLAIAAIAATGGQLYLFWQNMQTPRQTSPAAQVMTERDQSRPDIKLAGIDFFGAADTRVAENVDTENLPTTNLRLVLRGVSASELEENKRRLASALIEGPDRQTDYYLVGAELPGSAALKAVYADRIVIERQGSLENLYFPEEFETASFEAQEATPPVRTSDASSNPSIQNAGVQSNIGTSDARKEEIRARLERLRERLRSNN